MRDMTIEKLALTACCVTKNNGLVTYYGLLSIVELVDEILVFDDSDSEEHQNSLLFELQEQHENIRILNDRSLGKDLGKKKQFLVNQARHDICMRWDDDFILYSPALLKKCYRRIAAGEVDALVTQGLNLIHDFDHVSLEPELCREAYVYKKGCITFEEKNGFCDYPVMQHGCRIGYTGNEVLFLHLWNHKSLEQLWFRRRMTPFLLDGEFANYLEYFFHAENGRRGSYMEVIRFTRACLELEAHVDWSRTKPAEAEHRSMVPGSLRESSAYGVVNEDGEADTPVLRAPETNKNVNLFYWGGQYSVGNFGDYCAHFIFRSLSAYEPRYWPLIEGADSAYHYVTVGSVINKANSRSIVWGSGIISNKDNVAGTRRITCVRGPRTRERLMALGIQCPEVYGDPALLLPKIHFPTSPKKFKLGIIPHQVDHEHFQELFKDDESITVIDLRTPRAGVTDIIDRIVECERTLSSSLHGIIVSHAYGIPCMRIKHGKLAGDDVKFEDYFCSVYSFEYVPHFDHSWETRLTACEICRFFEGYRAPDLIEERQADLYGSCPFKQNMDVSLLDASQVEYLHD